MTGNLSDKQSRGREGSLKFASYGSTEGVKLSRWSSAGWIGSAISRAMAMQSVSSPSEQSPQMS